MKTLKFLTGLFVMLLISIEMFAGTNVVAQLVTTNDHPGGYAIAALATQKIVFMKSLKEEYDAIETWLNNAQDLSAFVKDGQTLVFPEAGADPAVYKNRTTDVDSVEPTETTNEVELDVYDSQNYKIRNIHLHALPFEKVQYYTKKSADAIVKKELADAAWALAPASAAAKRICVPTTGAAVGGLKTMTVADLLTFAMALDRAEFPGGRNLVLPSDMWWQLVNSSDVLKGQMERRPMDGKINPYVVEWYGIKIHKSLGDKLGVAWDISLASKVAQGTAIAGDVVPAGVLYCEQEVFKAGGMMEMFYVDKSQNPTGRAYEFGFQHRFKADFQMSSQRYSGLIYAGQ